MASVKGGVGIITQVLLTGFWLLVVLAVAFFALYLLQQKQPFGPLQKGATILANAAKGKEVN